MPPEPVHGAGLAGGNRGQCKGDSFRVKKSVENTELTKFSVTSPWNLPVPLQCGQHWEHSDISSFREVSLRVRSPISSSRLPRPQGSSSLRQAPKTTLMSSRPLSAWLMSSVRRCLSHWTRLTPRSQAPSRAHSSRISRRPRTRTAPAESWPTHPGPHPCPPPPSG